jgi:hypothetical protein
MIIIIIIIIVIITKNTIMIITKKYTIPRRAAPQRGQHLQPLLHRRLPRARRLHGGALPPRQEEDPGRDPRGARAQPAGWSKEMDWSKEGGRVKTGGLVRHGGLVERHGPRWAGQKTLTGQKWSTCQRH